MREALIEAQKAYSIGEVPIGSVVVYNDKIIGRGHNLRETRKDPTLHAEIMAIQMASRALGGWRLIDCDIYVTVEPCPMCAGAMVQGRLRRLIFGASDPKSGCAGSIYNLVDDNRFNHRLEIVSGIMESECRDLMKSFFKARRYK
ncbi:MAG: nucleoside deaminase [Clostridiales bacterium]|nr:nucleoside deaminase [Clostridiales bacterium]